MQHLHRSLTYPVAVLILALACSGCESITGASDIVYEVSIALGSGSASLITYSEGDATLQRSNVTLPWSYAYRASRGDHLYVSAQNANSSGCIRVAIRRRGELFDSAQSCGAFVIATVSGTN